MAGLRGVMTLIVLGGAVAALGLWMRDEGRRPLESPDDLLLGQPDEPAALPQSGEFRPDPFDRFAESLERPLFEQSRRPVVVAAPELPAPEPAAAPVLSATLTGVMFAGTGSMALVTEVGASSPVRITEGEQLDGWTLVEIRPDNVTFQQAGESVTLELIYRDDRPPPEKKRRQ
jgi:hypothetical protein